MNMIPAQGDPNSRVRRVQENPAAFLEAWDAMRAYAKCEHAGYSPSIIEKDYYDILRRHGWQDDGDTPREFKAALCQQALRLAAEVDPTEVQP
jgi:hypothetical protein